MKKNKKILMGVLASVSILALTACDTKPNNKTVPFGSLSDTPYASALDGKYTISEKQLYTKLRATSYDAFTKKIYSIVFGDSIDYIKSAYSKDEEIKKEIDDVVASACYSTTAPQVLKDMEADTIKENILKYIDSMAKKGVRVTQNTLTYDLVDTNDDGRLDKISFNNLQDSVISYYAYEAGLKYASKKYIESVCDDEQIYDYSKEEMIDNTYYIDDEAIKNRYNSTYKTYNDTKAIILRFNSARDADNAIEKVETKLGTTLSSSNALPFFVELYNTYYSYRSNLKIENGSLVDAKSISYLSDSDYTELNNISANFSTFYTEALIDGGFAVDSTPEGSYTAFPRAIDDKYFMVYRINTNYFTDTKEEVKYEELETELGKEKADELKAELKKELIDAKSSSTIATSSLFKNMLIDEDGDKKPDDNLDIKIFDPYYEYKFYTTYANDDYYSYIAKKDFNNDYLASITYNGKTTHISVKDFFTESAATNGAEVASNYLLNQYIYDTYKDQWLDSDDIDTIKDSFKASVKSFKNNETSIPKFLGIDTYYTINYGYATENEIYTQSLYSSALLSKYSSTYYQDDFFTYDEDSDTYKIDEDITMFKNMLQYSARIYKSLYSIDLSHFLISVDDDCDGTMDDPIIFREKLETPAEKEAFDQAVVELSKALVAETNFITTDKLDALKYLTKAFDRGQELQSTEYKGKTWDDFKYTYNFKITVESLGEIDQSSSSGFVKPFAAYIEETYKQVVDSSLDFEDDATYFFVNNLTDKNGKTDFSALSITNLCQTVYGYHVLIINDFDEPKNAYYSESSDPNKDYANIKVIVDEKDEDDDDDDIYFVTNAYNESTVNISINQLYIYFYEYVTNGSVTSISSNLKNAISSMVETVISRYTNSTFQKWLQFDELGPVTFYDTDHMIITYDDYIKSFEISIDGYTPDETFEGWFDLEWK